MAHVTVGFEQDTESRIAALEDNVKNSRAIIDAVNKELLQWSKLCISLQGRVEALENAGGTRLPEDWEPSGEDRLAAKRAGLDNGELIEEAGKYLAHWTDCTGQKAFKKDWPRTWRNWCGNAARYRGKPQAPKNEPKASIAGPNTAAAVEALSALMEPAGAVLVRELFCANRDLDRFILLALADNLTGIQDNYGISGIARSQQEWRAIQDGYRDRITAAANNLGFVGPVWPKVAWG